MGRKESQEHVPTFDAADHIIEGIPPSRVLPQDNDLIPLVPVSERRGSPIKAIAIGASLGLAATGVAIWLNKGSLYTPLFPERPPTAAVPYHDTPTPTPSQTSSPDKVIIIEPTPPPSSIISLSPTTAPSKLTPTPSTEPLPTEEVPSPSESPTPPSSVEPTESSSPTPTNTSPTSTPSPPANTEITPTATPDIEQGIKAIVGQVWTNTPDVWKAGSPAAAKWAAFDGPLNVSIMPGIDQHGRRLQWRGWQAAANGAHDEWWRTFAQNANTLRAGKGTTYLSPNYQGGRVEGNNPHFPAAWPRIAGIVRQEMPSAKLVLPASCTAGEALPDPSTYDVLSCSTRQHSWQKSKLFILPRLERARQQALAVNKPIAVNHSTISNHTQLQQWINKHAGTGPGQVIPIGD